MSSKGFFDHLEDFRGVLLKSLLGVFVGVSLSFVFVSFIFEFLSQPYFNYLTEIGAPATLALKSLSPSDTLKVSFRASFLFGIGIASPWIAYQLWIFIAPALYRKEKKHTVLFCSSIVLFFLAGTSFAYFVVLPTAISFFHKYSMSMGVLPEWTIENYFGFVIMFLAGFGVVFELPVLIVLLSWLGLTTSSWLKSKRKHAAILIFIVAAIFTPPDIISQFMMALPMLGLFEISILAARVIERVKA